MPEPTSNVVGVVWYERDTYDQSLSLFTDREDLHDNYGDWRAQADLVVEMLSREGKTVAKALIEPQAFAEWCSIQGLEVDAKARSRFANEVAANHTKQQA